jgi:hypothetical protein
MLAKDFGNVCYSQEQNHELSRKHYFRRDKKNQTRQEQIVIWDKKEEYDNERRSLGAFDI